MADVTDPNDPERYAYLAEGNATQARKRVAADLLIRDTTGRVLLVDPTYKEHFDLPGGMAETNEPPSDAAAREVKEELGLDIVPGRLLLVDWVGPHGPWDDQIVFIFDGGTLDNDAAASVKAVDPEIAGYTFAALTEGAGLLRPDVHRRLQQAHQAMLDDITVYGEHDRT